VCVQGVMAASRVRQRSQHDVHGVRLRAHDVDVLDLEDASVRAITATLVFPIVYPLLAVLQACADINASSTLRHDNGNRQCIS